MQTNRATIRQALQLTSGIADYTTDAFLNALAVAPQRVWSPAELVGLVADEPPMFPAGTSWYYSNTNYVMLGIVAEQVTGQPLGQLITDRIFTPLEHDRLFVSGRRGRQPFRSRIRAATC